MNMRALDSSDSKTMDRLYEEIHIKGEHISSL